MKKGGENMNKKVVVPFVALAVLAFGTLFTQGYASAQETTNPESTIVEKIATKFNLNRDEVQKVFDEQKAEMHTQMQAKNEERLNQLVTDGKITEAQKTLILNKQKEIQAEREANKGSISDKTPEQRKTEMDAKKAEIEAWAKENGINPTYIFPGKGIMGGHGPRMGR